MQPKFTQQRLGHLWRKIMALALIFSVSTQFSFGQQNPAQSNTLSLFAKQKADQQNKVFQKVQNAKMSSIRDNDAGLPNRVINQLANNPQAVCTTITGTVSGSDPSTSLRSFRDGTIKTCGAPGTCQAGLTGTFQYKIAQWTNPNAAAQCVTVTRSTTSTDFSFVTVFSASPTLTNLCTNWVSDEGTSASPGLPNTFSFNIPGNATYYFLITNVTAGTTTDYSIVIDAPTCTGGPPPPPPPCSFTAAPVYPVNILDQAAATVGTNLYSFAGVSNNAVIANAYKFDGTTWTAIAPYPVAEEWPAAASNGTDVYIVGGSDAVGAVTTTLRRYNVASNTYTTLAPCSVPTWNHAFVYLNGKIYKITGFNVATATTAVEIYDIASNTWSLGAPYPQGNGFVNAWASGNYIYAGGGTSPAGVESAKTYRYDPATNTWDDAAIADLPATRWGAATTAYNGGGVLAGGYVTGAISSTVLQWDQATNLWTSLPNLVGVRSRMTGAVVGGSFYVIGGRQINDFVGTNNNQKLFCIPPTPCSGAPDPGNTVSSSNPVCSNTSFTLSLQNNPFQSGFAYQWQKSSDGVNFTDIAGATSSTLTTTQTGATWYRAKVTCTPSSTTTNSNPLLVADGQGVFNSHPVNASTTCGGNASFSFTATGNALVYGWEYRLTPASPWLTVNNGGVYSGANSNNLVLTNVPSSMNGYQYRGLISGPCTAVDFSNVATLTVNPLVATVTPTSATICLGQIQALTLTNTPTPTVFSSGPLNITIPDGNAAATTSVLAVSGLPAAIPSEVSVTLNMTHTYPADMIINLKAPNGQILSLYKHNTNTDNGAASVPNAGFYDAKISSLGTVVFKTVPTPFRYGITPPTGPFQADNLNGTVDPGYTIQDITGYNSNAAGWGSLTSGALNGNWTLAMADGGAGDIGIFTGWSLSFSFGNSSGVWTQTVPVVPPNPPGNTMFTDALATVPYVAGTPANTIYVKPTVNSTYCVVYSTSTCTSAPTCVNVNVSTPVTGVTVTPTSSAVCLGGNTSFTANTTGGGPLTYQWQVSIDGGLNYTDISGQTAQTLNLNNVGQLMNNYLYRVKVSSGPCGSSNSVGAALTVKPLPTVVISAPDLALTPGQSTTISATSTPPANSATSYSWTRNGVTLVGVNTSSIVVGINELGTYRATVTANNLCVNSSNDLVIGSEKSDRLWIYPNPTTGKFEVRLFFGDAITENRYVTVFNSQGQIVATKEVVLTNVSDPYTKIEFDLTNMAAGPYVVKVAHKRTGKITSGIVIKQTN
jgi:subtilisin-like proprotein convertase family protein